MENTDTKKNSWFIGGGIEVSLVTIIISVGWFLIGYYTKYEYLVTGYQDWIYHAFRVRDVAQFGIASWDHVWGNGLNHWRAFQYVEHVFTYWVSLYTGFSITHSMLWISAIVFIAIRFFMYIAMRILGVSPMFSFFAVITSYAFSQQWIALKDYSIFIGFLVVPFYTLLWIVALKNPLYLYVTAAVAGALWSVHPVVGYSATGMFFFLLLVNNLKQYPIRLVVSLTVFFLSSLPFTIPYFFSGYNLSNPIFETRQFLQDTILHEYFGLSLIYFILLGLSWMIMIWKSKESPRWAKLLLFYSTAYLIFIYFGQQGYYPAFINKFQFSRAIPFIAFLLNFCFAAFLHTVFSASKSRMVTTVILVLAVITISQSIEVASLYTAQPEKSIQEPVSMYFSSGMVPNGSIYFKNGVESSYFTNSGLRFITSYNQHMLPNPYPIRFDNLMKTDISYTGVTETQTQLIIDYSLVLGVEYLFIPQLSPLVDALTLRQGLLEPAFEKVDEVKTDADAYAVLRNRQPIAYAYVFEAEEKYNYFRFTDLPKPTLNATSYSPWDQEISRVAGLIREGKLKSIPLSFEWPNRLVINTGDFSSFQHPNLVVAQSYDRAWEAEEVMGLGIEPTNLRFMYINFLEASELNQITLKNEWPWWHWPIQSAGVIMVAITTLWLLGSLLWNRHSTTETV